MQVRFDELVQSIEISLSPELAGEIADGQVTGAVGGAQVIAGEVHRQASAAAGSGRLQPLVW